MLKPSNALVFALVASLGACATLDQRHGFASVTSLQPSPTVSSGFAEVSQPIQPVRWGFAEPSQPERPARWGFVDLPVERDLTAQVLRP